MTETGAIASQAAIRKTASVKTIPLVLLCAFAATAAAHVPEIRSPASAGGPREITVNAAAPTGELRALNGVNGAPGPGNHKPPEFVFGGWNMPEGIDVSTGYKKARIDLVRTHDSYGPGDIDPKFGPKYGTPGAMVPAQKDELSLFPDMNADPADPNSYNFGPTDRMIASIVNSGAEVMFRIGRSETSNVDPPADFDRYAEIVRHIVLHYNHGWANGFQYNIRYWEVWNEPDLGKLFWGGTPQQFFELYAKIARAVKEADPRALIGGPALARPNDATPYRDEFLHYVRAQNLPLDFYSWHWYATDSNDPLDVIRIGREMRSRLDSQGFTKTLSVVNEWNYGLMEPLPHDAQRAGFIAAALTYMQDEPIDLSAIYRADNLFGQDGATPNKVGQALIALGHMKDTPVRLKVTGPDENGFAVQAGRSRDGKTLQVLIANYQIPAEFLGPRAGPDRLSVPGVFDVGLLKRRSIEYRDNTGYNLRIANLPRKREYTVERYRISYDSDFTLVDRTAHRGKQIRLSATLPPPGIELIIVRTP